MHGVVATFIPSIVIQYMGLKLATRKPVLVRLNLACSATETR